MPTTIEKSLAGGIAPGTQEILDLQAGDIGNRIRGRESLGKFLDFNIGSLPGADPFLGDDRFDFSTAGGGFRGFDPIELSAPTGDVFLGGLGGDGGLNLNPQLRQTGQEQLLQQFRSGSLPQGQLDLIQGIFDPIRQRGQSDIMQFADELAGRGGLNLSDSPVAGAATRSLSDLFSNLGGQQAQATLGQFNTNLGNLFNLTGQQNQLQQQGFQNRLTGQGFQEQLRQNAIQNRLALLGGGTPGADITSPLLQREGLNRTLVTDAPSPEDSNFLDIFGKVAPGIGDFFRGGPGGGPSGAQGLLDFFGKIIEKF
jgi:hypothetical protein